VQKSALLAAIQKSHPTENLRAPNSPRSRRPRPVPTPSPFAPASEHGTMASSVPGERMRRRTLERTQRVTTYFYCKLLILIWERAAPGLAQGDSRCPA